MNLAASVDLGTNTVRLLVVDASARPHKTVRLESRIVRLGGGFVKEGKLTEEAMSRALAALREYGAILRELKCTQVAAVGTGVLRQAPNTPEFLERVRRETGLSIQIIPGEREAELSVKGALWALGVKPDSSERYVVCDVGGGSTEFALWEKGKIPARVSVPVGVVSLTETFLLSDPPTADQVERVRHKLRQAFSDLGAVPGTAARGAFTLVGCSGTFTTLASLQQNLAEYDPAKITGYRLRVSHLEGLLAKALPVRAQDRLALWRVLPKGREDVIVAGMILTWEILRRWDREEALITDGSLLEGVLLDLLERLEGRS